MSKMTSGRLISVSALVLVSVYAKAETFHCRDTAGVNLSQYGISTSSENNDEFALHEWIVDTDKGWRRSDVPQFNGACQANSGYVVCKAHDIAFGEATFSIHPDGTNFMLTFLDYGLGTLAFVGKCTRFQPS